MNDSTIVPRRTEQPVHEVDERGETVLYDRDGGHLIVLNDVGAGVWTLIDGERSAGDIASIIVEALEAPQEAVERDVVAFLEQLREHDLICTA